MDEVKRDAGSFTIVEPGRVRAAIAAALLQDSTVHEENRFGRSIRLGSIDLHPHQVDAVRRLRSAVAEFGGALLCDPVGTGKTFTALALVPAASKAVVVAPAALLPMWREAAGMAERSIVPVSFESLSRREIVGPSCRFLIVDEAHHARNPATKRFTSLARLAFRKKVLLLSATPIHNRRRDLAAVLSLFLGVRGHLTPAEMGRCVLRRDDCTGTSSALPSVAPLTWLDIGVAESALPARILSLPPPLPPSDGGDGGALIAHSLIRQWASSAGALRGGIVRRLRRSVALISALEDGTYPSRSELAAWSGREDVVQLAFASLVAAPSGEAALLLPVIRAHREALAVLLSSVKEEEESADGARASAVRRIRRMHANEKIIAFTQFADTVGMLFERLAPDGGVAALTGSRARVAGGCLTRGELIDRFAPLASHRAPPGRAEAITLLITTDILSEGVNLQDASVVIHLDLPWTPARMEQRLGRVARLGSLHERVTAYALRPPAGTEALIRIGRILRDKMNEAGIIVPMFASLCEECGSGPNAAPTQPSLVERQRATVAGWANQAEDTCYRGALVASVSAPAFGYLAAYRRNGHVRLIGSRDGRVSDDPALVLECAAYCGGAEEQPPADDCRAVLASLNEWIEASHALDGAGSPPPRCPDPARAVLHRIALAIRHARPHERNEIISLCDIARRAITAARGVDAQHRLADIAALEADDKSWLRHVIASFASVEEEMGPGNISQGHGVVALIIFGIRDRVAR